MEQDKDPPTSGGAPSDPAGERPQQHNDHRSVGVAVRSLEKERREMVQKLMQEWEETYYRPRMRELRNRCAELGHKWHFSDFGPLGDPWYRCGVCGAAECRREERRGKTE